MKVRKALVHLFVIIMLTAGCVSVAGAWQYGVDTYDYTGSPALWGTIPGASYTAKVAAITNDSSASEALTVDLYYGGLNGRYQYSTDEGVHWINISDDTTQWTRTVSAGDTVWLRVVLLNWKGHIYHFLSPSPWGEADQDYNEAYYWAFPPAAHYYNSSGDRDITGYVAVASPSMI